MRIVTTMALMFLIASYIMPLGTAADEGHLAVMTEEKADEEENEDDRRRADPTVRVDHSSVPDLPIEFITDTFAEIDSQSLISRRHSGDVQVLAVTEENLLHELNADNTIKTLSDNQISQSDNTLFDRSVYDYSDLREMTQLIADTESQEASERKSEAEQSSDETSERKSESEQSSDSTSEGKSESEQSSDTRVDTDSDTDSEPPAATEKEEVRKVKARVTAYAPFDNQSGICNDGNPNVTSTGQKPGPAIIAVDPAKIPYGTKLKIEGFSRTFIAGDTGGALRRYQGVAIDVFFETYREAIRFGVQYLEVEIIG